MRSNVGTRIVIVLAVLALLGLGGPVLAGADGFERAGVEVDRVEPIPARARVDDTTEPAPAEPSATAPPDCPASWRAVRLNCKPNADGLVTGNYGGTDFFLTCADSSTRICASGTSFRYIMEGGTAGGPQVRCALSGDDVQVNEFCGPLHLIIN